jgi:hypothetical protein
MAARTMLLADIDSDFAVKTALTPYLPERAVKVWETY